MTTRDIPTLSTTILKEIAKSPSKYVTEKSFQKAQLIKLTHKGFDLSQVITTYVIEAGRLTDDALPLCVFANRVALSLKNSKISSTYLLRIVHQSPALASLDLSGTFMVDDHCVRVILQSCPNLEKIGLQNCRKLTNSTLESISQWGSKLNSVRIGGNFNITADGLLSYFRSPRAAQLKDLSVAGLPLTNEIISLIAKNCKLTRLKLAYCFCFESTLRMLISQIGANLENLSIAWMGSTIPENNDYQISAEFVSEFIPRTCPRLTEIDVTGLKNVTANCLMAFLDTKLSMVESSGGDVLPLRVLGAKFIGSSRNQLEQTICSSYTYLKIII